MKTIDSILEQISGFLVSINHDTSRGCYEMIIGIPSTWTFNENKNISCEILDENKNGKLIKLSPKVNYIGVDDLVQFTILIIETNKIIADKEEEFLKKIEGIKNLLEEEITKHNGDVDELKEASFKKFGESELNNTDSSPETIENGLDTKIRKSRITKLKKTE
jgi:hypothetical protein